MYCDACIKSLTYPIVHLHTFYDMYTTLSRLSLPAHYKTLNKNAV